jgi:anti-sigma28 factor (negative regulator of flagellin synthesis)
MTVDNVTRLVRALGDDPTQRTSNQSSNSKNTAEGTAAEAAKTGNEAVKFTSRFSSDKSEGADPARSARVAHFKEQYNQVILKPADSEKVAESLARDLFA